MDDSLFLALIAGGALILVGAIAVVAFACRRTLRGEAPPPFFGMLQRQGLTLKQAEEAVGIEGLAAGVRRCALCGEQHACRARFALGWLASRKIDCPNKSLFERLK
jgi:hypothetical protein